MVDFTWTLKIRLLLWCTRKSYPGGSPQGLAGRSPSCMARMAKHNSAHAPRSLEPLMFIPRRCFSTHLPSFPPTATVENSSNKKRGLDWPHSWNLFHDDMLVLEGKVYESRPYESRYW